MRSAPTIKQDPHRGMNLFGFTTQHCSKGVLFEDPSNSRADTAKRGRLNEPVILKPYRGPIDAFRALYR